MDGWMDIIGALVLIIKRQHPGTEWQLTEWLSFSLSACLQLKLPLLKKRKIYDVFYQHLLCHKLILCVKKDS